jgi:quinol monooxygenase YgiN
LKVDGSFLKDLLYFVKLSFLITPTGGDLNKYINGDNQNSRWISQQGQDVLELVTTKQVQYFDFMVSWPERGAGWCIYEDDVLVYKDVVNLGTGRVPDNEWYHYPLNNGNLPHKLLPIENSVGQGWRLIRQLPPNSVRWFPGDINFTDVNEDEELLFTTGDCSRWIITIKHIPGSNPKIKGSPFFNPFPRVRNPILASRDDSIRKIHRVLSGVDSDKYREPFLRFENGNKEAFFLESSHNTFEKQWIDSSGMYVYARPMKFTFDQLDPIVSQIGSGWKLIRHVMGSDDFDSRITYPNQWFAGDTNFSEVHNDDELLFTTGDCSYWCITTRYNVCGTFTGSGGKLVTAIDSTFGQTNILIFYRAGVTRDPTIKLRNQSNQNVWRMYTEDLNNQYDVNNIHSSGMYVYTRPRQIVRYPSRYKQITTSYDGVTGQVSSSSESYINALTSSYTIDGNGSTVENLSNHKNELINIITTTIPDPENIITIINEDKRTNIITTTKKENDAIKAVEDTIKQIIVENPQNYLGVQITIEDDFVSGKKSTITTNHIDTSEFVTRTVVTFIADDTFDSWTEVSETKTIDATTTEVTTTHKNEDGSARQTVTLTTSDTELIRVTENFTDKSDFETQTYTTLLNGDFDSWIEVSETQTIDATTTEVTTTHKNEDGSIQQTITLTTTDTESIRVTENFTDKSEFETQTYVTLLNDDFVSWTEVSETQTIDATTATTTEVTTTHKNEDGSIQQTVTFTTTDTESIRVTENFTDKSEFETQIYTTLLNGDFVSWIEKIESYPNLEGNLEFARNIKDASGTTNVNVQIVTTIIDGDNNTKTVQTVNTIDKSDFETKRIVTDSSNNDAFISWSEESETIVNGNVEEITTVEKDENGNFLRIETTSTDSTANSVSLFERDVSPGTTFVNSDRKVLPPLDIPGYNAWFEPAVFNNNYFFINHSTGSYMDGQYKVKASSILPASGSNPNRIPTFSFDHITDPPTYNLYVSEENTFDANGVITYNHPDGVIIDIVLPDSLSISYYTLQTRDAHFDQMCKKWVFEASTNNVDWILLDSRENETGWSVVKEERTYHVPSSSSYENKRPPYRYYRWRILETNGSSLVAIFGIKLYGFIYSSKLTTTITNGDGSEKITESFTNLLSVIKEINSSGTETLVKTINPPNSSHEIHVVEEDKLTNIRTTTKKDATNTELDAFTMVDTTIPSLGVLEIIIDYLTSNGNNEFITTIDNTMNGGNFITITKNSTEQELFRETEYPKDNSNNTVTVIRIEVFPVVVYPDIYETTTVYQSSVNPANIQTITEESPPSSVPINGFIETFSRESDSTEILFERLVKENATDKIETITSIASYLITNFKTRELVYTISSGVENVVSVTDTSDDDLSVPGITTVVVSEKDIASTDYNITKFTTTTSTDDSTNIVTTVIVENIDPTLISAFYVKQTTDYDSSENPETITTQYAPSNNKINIVIEDVDASYPTIKFRTTTYAEADFPNIIISITEETSPYTINGITETIAIERNPDNDAIITRTKTTIDTNVSPNTTTVVIENEQDTTAFKLRTIESISGSVESVTDISEVTVVGDETTEIVSEKDITSTDYAIATRTTTTITNSALVEKTVIIENFVSTVINDEYKKETKVFDTSSGSDVLVSTTTQFTPQTVGGSTTTEVVTIYENVIYDAVYRETTIYDGTIVDGGTILTITQELAEDTSSPGVTAITINEYESGSVPGNLLVKTTVTTTDTTNNTLTIQESYTDANDYSGIADITTRYNDSSYSTQSGAIQNITVTITYTGLSETPSAIQSVEEHAITATPGSFEILKEKVSGVTDKITTTDTNTPGDRVTVVEDYPNAGSLELSQRTRIYNLSGDLSGAQPDPIYRPQTGLLDVENYQPGLTNYDDDYLNLKGGYAVKHLYTGYTGYHLRVSRSSDSTEVDLKFDENGVVVSSNPTISDYSSWFDGYVVNVITWYDQSGKGNHGIAQGTVTFDYVNKRVVLGTDGYFSLPDGTVPYGDDPYTMIFDHGSSTDDNGVIISSGYIGSNRKSNVFRRTTARHTTNYKYTNSWYGDDFFTDDYTYNPMQVVTFRYDNTTNNQHNTRKYRSFHHESLIKIQTNTTTRSSEIMQNVIGVLKWPDDRFQWFWKGEIYSILIYKKALDYSDIDFIANRLRPS